MPGVVGLKPTVGLLSRSHVVPISHRQDTPGPIGRRVEDVALLLSIMAGTDPSDPLTAPADARKTDYVAALSPGALQGKRLGAIRFTVGPDAEVRAAFDQALTVLTTAGAEIVEVKPIAKGPIIQNELDVLLAEFKVDIQAYLATTPAAVKPRTLADLIAFNNENASVELKYFGQEIFEQAQATSGLDTTEYQTAITTLETASRANGLDAFLANNDVVALVHPSANPAWKVDLAASDPYTYVETSFPAIAGYPHLTVPMGQIAGLPVGLSFVGPPWSEAELLALGYAYERSAKARQPPGSMPP
jgi:amidase